MTYSYDPTQIRAGGKDQMRFELGDTFVEDGVETCALSDEEYIAIIGDSRGRNAWLMTKLAAIEAIMFKLSYMVDTKIDVLSYGLGKRAEHWQSLYDKIRAQILANTALPAMAQSALEKPPYFHTAMKQNYRVTPMPGETNQVFPFRNMTE